jgi:hypothetical protein
MLQYWPKATLHQRLTEPGTRQLADDAVFCSSSVFGDPWGHLRICGVDQK